MDRDSGAQAERAVEPLALTVIAVAALALILAVNLPTRSAPIAAYQNIAMGDCAGCGTVIAVRRSAHSTPIYFIDVMMLDGSVRTVRQFSAFLSIGDFVQINGDSLTLRNTPS